MHGPVPLILDRLIHYNDQGTIMKTYLARVLALFVLLGITGAATAEETARVVWICTVNEGKTLDDVRSANSAWVRFMHDKVDKKISSSILTPVIGDFEGGRFVFADDFPSFEAWNAARKASESDEGQAIDAAINAAATCTTSSLYSAEKS